MVVHVIMARRLSMETNRCVVVTLRSKFLVFVFLVFLISVPFIVESYGFDDVSVAGAEEALGSSYGAVLAAEQAGANVSSLVAQFNVGCEYLSQAYMWDSLGNSENSSYFVGLSYTIAGDVQSEALALKDEAIRASGDNFFTTTVVSIVSIVAIIVLSFVVWRVFKRYYFRRVVGLNQGGSVW